MTKTTSGGGEATSVIHDPHLLTITEPDHRRAVTDLATLFPDGSFDFELGADGPALVYEVPDGVRARRVVGSPVATVEIPWGDRLSATIVRVYQDVAEGRRATMTDIDPRTRGAYSEARTELDVLGVMAARHGGATAAEFAGVPDAAYPDVMGVLAEAYRQETALEAARFALQGLAELVLPD